MNKSNSIDFFFANLADYLPFVTITTVGSFIGLIGNLSIVGAIFLTKELRKTSSVIILNLAVSDLIICLFVNTFNVVGTLSGKSYFDDKKWLCHMIAFSVMILCMCSLLSMTILAFNRYVYICQEKYYKKLFSKRNTLIYCIIAWSTGLITETIAILIFGWKVNFFDSKTLGCTWNRLLNKPYTITLMSISILIPSLAIPLFYSKIYFFASQAKLKAHNNISKYNEIKESFKIAKGMFLTFLIFSICWLPYALNIIIDSNDENPISVYVWTIQLAMLNSSLNPIVYALTNSLLKKGFKNLIHFILCQKENSSNTNKKSSADLNNSTTL